MLAFGVVKTVAFNFVVFLSYHTQFPKKDFLKK